MPTILTTIPFVLFLVLLFWKKSPLVWVSLITFIFVGLLSVFYWKIFPGYLLGSIVKGFLVAVDILFIIIGAIFFLDITKEAGVIANISHYFGAISKDIRIQVIFLAWFFENFLEGTAGFGTPSTVVAPLMVSLGISPLNAIIISLLGNSTSVAFGAAGTPIKVGFGALAGMGLPLKAALVNSVGVLIPVFMIWFLLKGKDKKHFFEALPIAIWSGVLFVVPSILIIPLGQEFPSILGSVIGLVLFLITTKLGIFVPKNVYKIHENDDTKATLPIEKVLFPYILLIVFLIAGKFLLGSTGIVVKNVIKHTFAFFNPGFVFLLVGGITALFFKMPLGKTLGSLKNSAVRSVEPFLVIVFMSALSQIMVNSGSNFTGFLSMIDYLAIHVKNALLPIYAPFVGAFGSFLTGSATVSNLMFGNFLASIAKSLNFNVDTILALSLVGGAAGNMIALADMLAAETVVGLKHEERNVIKGVIVPCFVYLILVGTIGMFIF